MLEATDTPPIGRGTYPSGEVTCGTGTIRETPIRDRGASWDRPRGSRGGRSERDDERLFDPRDVFVRAVDLPLDLERELVRDRDRTYELNGTDSRVLATVGAFRVVAESDLERAFDNPASARDSVKHLRSRRPPEPQPVRAGRTCRVSLESRARPAGSQPVGARRPVAKTRPGLLRGPQEAARAGARLPGLSRLPAGRGAPPKRGRAGSTRGPRLRAQARLPTVPAGPQSGPGGQ